MSYFNKGHVTKENLAMQRPDPYRATMTSWKGFEFLGCIDKCGREYEELAQMVKDNGDTAVGLKFSIGNGGVPNRVQLSRMWWENMIAVDGLTVKITIEDIDGNEIVPVPALQNLDLSKDPAASCESCNGCGEGEDTFGAYKFDDSADNLVIGRCNTANIMLEILTEPTNGLLGTSCDCMPIIRLRGGLGFEAFCIDRGIEHSDCGGNFACLDGCPAEPTP